MCCRDLEAGNRNGSVQVFDAYESATLVDVAVVGVNFAATGANENFALAGFFTTWQPYSTTITISP